MAARNVSVSKLENKNWNIPDSTVHGASIGPTWVLSAPGGPHVGPVNLATRDVYILEWNAVVWLDYNSFHQRMMNTYNYSHSPLLHNITCVPVYSICHVATPCNVNGFLNILGSCWWLILGYHGIYVTYICMVKLNQAGVMHTGHNIDYTHIFIHTAA